MGKEARRWKGTRRERAGVRECEKAQVTPAGKILWMWRVLTTRRLSINLGKLFH